MIHRQKGLGLTATTLCLTLAVTGLILSVIITLSGSYKQLHEQTRNLATSEMESLMTSVRLVQQSESLGNLGVRLTLARTHPARRRALIDLTDHMTWVGQLTNRIARQGEEPELIEQARQTLHQLEQNTAELNLSVSERIDGNTDAGLQRHIEALSSNNRELSGQLAVLVGYFSANTRRQMVNQSEILASDIQTQRYNLIALSLVVMLFALLAGIYFEFRIVRRILHLERTVRSPTVDTDAFDTLGGDEISRLSRTVRSYVQRIQTHEAQMRRAHQEMTYLAEHDMLTGLANRRHFQAAARRLLRESRQPLCIAIGDLDYFKRINDRYGHAAGDQVLVDLARLLEKGIRESDVLARFGGEEFAFILPVGSLEDAQKVIEKLRTRLAEHSIAAAPNQSIHLSMSFGLVLVDASNLEQPLNDQHLEALLDSALRAADEALYSAKHNGRNQVELAPETLYANAI